MSAWRDVIDTAWRTPVIRKEFESATGLEPLGTSVEEIEAQNDSGATAIYHDRFVDWATCHLGLTEFAPAEVRERMAAS